MMLAVENLTSHFLLRKSVLKAVDDVSFQVNEGETVALVGESGCGKTMVARSLLHLVPAPGRVVGGKVLFRGEDILSLPSDRLRSVRGAGIGMVFQEPAAAFNPVLSVGHQIAEVLTSHRGLSRREAHLEAVRILGETGIPEPERTARAFPFQLSGGMCQRAQIAIAISARPQLLIADEPTTALDVAIKADIIDLFVGLQEVYGMAILLITHDIAVVSKMAQRALVMYTGKIVEAGTTGDLLRNPMHPYTQGLLQSVARLGAGRKVPFHSMPGSVPKLTDLPSGCTFHPRCDLGDASCQASFPVLSNITPRRQCACFKVAGY